MITAVVFVWMVLYAWVISSVMLMLVYGLERKWIYVFLWFISFLLFFWLFSSFVQEWKGEGSYLENFFCVKPETKSCALFCKNLLKWDKPMNISEKTRI